jgi:hypothetical protein
VYRIGAAPNENGLIRSWARTADIEQVVRDLRRETKATSAASTNRLTI